MACSLGDTTLVEFILNLSVPAKAKTETLKATTIMYIAREKIPQVFILPSNLPEFVRLCRVVYKSRLLCEVLPATFNASLAKIC